MHDVLLILQHLKRQENWQEQRDAEEVLARETECDGRLTWGAFADDE